MIIYNEIKEHFDDIQDNSSNGQEKVFIRFGIGLYIYADLANQEFDLFVQNKHTPLQGVNSIEDIKSLIKLIKGNG